MNQLLNCLELLLATHDSTDFRRLHATVRCSCLFMHLASDCFYQGPCPGHA